MEDLFLRLPCDLQWLCLRQWAAGRIQAGFMRWHRYRHARHPVWAVLRARLTRVAHDRLRRHWAVRREWVREPSSWVAISDETLHVILDEVEAGLWGAPVPTRLVTR